MADEVTFSTIEGKTAYDYRLLRESTIAALYPYNNLLQFLTKKSIANFASDSERFPKDPVLAASALTDGTDMDNTPYTPTQVTLTVGEVGLLVTRTDLAGTSDIQNLAHYGANMGRAVGKKLTSDIAALGSGFSTELSDTTADMTESDFLLAIATLQALDVPGPYYAVLHTQTWWDLVASIGSTYSAASTTGALSARGETNAAAANDQGVYKPLFGVTPVTNSSVPTATAGADSMNWMAGQGAVCYVEKWAARTEVERDASLRGTEVAVVSAYAVGELDDQRGVGLKFDR